MRSSNAIKSIILIVVSIVPILVIYFYPVVDWVTAPLLIYLFMSPILVSQIILLFLLVKVKMSSRVLVVQLILTIIMYLIMIHYLRTH